MANNQVSSQARGIVVILQGKAWVVSAEGVRKTLQVGDEVQEGQKIITEDGTRLELALPNGQPLLLTSGRELLIEGNLLGTDPSDKTDAAISDLNSGAAQIAKTLAGTGDLSLELDPTAAGLAGGQSSESHSFVRVLRIEEELEPLSIERSAQAVTSEILPFGAPVVDVPSVVSSVSSPSVVEGGNLDFVVTLSNASSTPTIVTLTPSSGTGSNGAVLGIDTAPAPTEVSFDGGVTYTPISGASITVPAGNTSFIVRLPTTLDGLIEPTETISLGAATPSNAGPVVATASILDAAAPSVSISGASDVNEAAGTVTYTVTLSAPSLASVSVNYTTSDVTASAGSDYELTTGTGNICSGRNQ